MLAALLLATFSFISLAPDDGTYTAEATVHVAGTVGMVRGGDHDSAEIARPSDGYTVVVNGARSPIVDGAFDVALSLPEGRQTIEVQAFQANGTATEKRRLTIVVDRTPPSWEGLPEGETLESKKVLVPILAHLSEDGCAVEVSPSAEIAVEGRRVSGSVRVDPGRTTLVTLRAQDRAGNVGLARFQVACTRTPAEAAYDIYGDRFERKGESVTTRGTGIDTEGSVFAGLLWLARHQAEDGRWSACGFESRCVGRACGGAMQSEDPADVESFDPGVTGLAVLAFLGNGVLPTETAAPRRFATAVGQVDVSFERAAWRGLQFLASRCDERGCVISGGRYSFPGQAYAAMALAEGYGMTGDPGIRAAAERAVGFLLDAQNPYRGWGRTPKSGDNSSRVTARVALALEAAERAGIRVGRPFWKDGVRGWYDSVTVDDGRVGESKMGDEEHDLEGASVAMPLATAGALALSATIGGDAQKRKRMVDSIAYAAKRWDEASAGPIDYEFVHMATLGLFRRNFPGNAVKKEWRAWNGIAILRLVSSQRLRSAGCADGSWDPDDGWLLGRAGTTALNVITLETYYR